MGAAPGWTSGVGWCSGSGGIPWPPFIQAASRGRYAWLDLGCGSVCRVPGRPLGTIEPSRVPWALRLAEFRVRVRVPGLGASLRRLLARPRPVGAALRWTSGVGWCSGSRGVLWAPLSQAASRERCAWLDLKCGLVCRVVERPFGAAQPSRVPWALRLAGPPWLDSPGAKQPNIMQSTNEIFVEEDSNA